MTQYMQEAGAMKQLTDAEILHLWDTHVAYETGGSAKQPPLDDKDKLAFARAALAAALPPAAVQAGTPGAQWREKGEPDPHGNRYDCERVALALGALTDDELANGAFMNYDQRLSLQDMLKPKPGQHMPIVWMTAVKDRIRWLSRKLAAANEGTLTAGKQGGDGVTAVEPVQLEVGRSYLTRNGATVRIAESGVGCFYGDFGPGNQRRRYAPDGRYCGQGALAVDPWDIVADGVAWLASTADVSDKDAVQSVLTGRSLDEIRADVAKLRADLADGVKAAGSQVNAPHPPMDSEPTK